MVLASTARTQTWPEAKAAGSGTLHVYGVTYPPYMDFPERDSAIGIEPDLLRAFAAYVQQAHGVQLKLAFEPYVGYNDMFPSLQASEGNTVAMGLISILASRRLDFDFTVPYLPDVELLISSPDMPVLGVDESGQITGLPEDTRALAGRQSSTYEHFLVLKEQAAPGLEIDTTHDETRETLVTLQEEPHVITYFPLLVYLQKLPGNVRIRRQEVYPVVDEGLAYMLPKGSSWKAILDEFLSQPGTEGIIMEILEKHLGKDARATYEAFIHELNTARAQNAVLELRERTVFQDSLIESQQQAERQRRWLWFSGIALVFFVVVLVLVVRQSRYRKHVTARLQQQTDQLAQANHELQAMQKQVVETEKMALLGQLISNVAHQLNSPVGAVWSSAKLATQQLPEVLADMSQVREELPVGIRQQLEALMLERHKNARTMLRLPMRERRQLRKELMKLMPSMPEEKQESLAEKLITLGVRAPEDIPQGLLELPQEAWAHYARAGRLLAGLRNIERGAERTSRFVELLRLYISRGPDPAPLPVPVAPMVRRVLNDLSSSFGAGITIETQLDEEAYCNVPKQWLYSVVAQPLLNAAEALRGKGTLSIHLQALEKGAKLSIADTGPGLPKEIEERLFEPFVTTKVRGEGLGLGLFLVKRTLKALGGAIELETGPSGTRVTMLLP